MTNRVGLWIDHKQAVIVSVEEQGEIRPEDRIGRKTT